MSNENICIVCGQPAAQDDRCIHCRALEAEIALERYKVMLANREALAAYVRANETTGAERGRHVMHTVTHALYAASHREQVRSLRAQLEAKEGRYARQIERMAETCHEAV